MDLGSGKQHGFFLDMKNESSKTRAVARFLALGDFVNGNNTVIMA